MKKEKNIHRTTKLSVERRIYKLKKTLNYVCDSLKWIILEMTITVVFLYELYRIFRDTL